MKLSTLTVGLLTGVTLSFGAVFTTFMIAGSMNPTMDTIEYVESRYLGR